MLEKIIRTERAKKDILLMSHLVLGYPSLEDNFAMIQQMSNADVELIELQIPFTEPSADGPTIVKANQDAIANGITVKECIQFAKKVADEFPKISFLFMTYCNIIYQFSYDSFLKVCSEIGIKALIVPDLPPEEAAEYLDLCKKYRISNISIVTPTHTVERMKYIEQLSSGMVYGVARKGVTGSTTEFGDEIERQITKYRENIKLPLAIGFGIKSKEDINFLKGKVDIAVIGTQIIRVAEEKGIKEIGPFLSSLR